MESNSKDGNTTPQSGLFAKTKGLYAVIVGGALLLGGVAGFASYSAQKKLGDYAVRQEAADDIHYLTERILKDVPTALTGDHKSYVSLFASVVQLKEDIAIFKDGTGAVAPLDEAAQKSYVNPLSESYNYLSKIQESISLAGRGNVETAIKLSDIETMIAKSLASLDKLQSYSLENDMSSARLGSLLAMSTIRSSLKQVLSNLSTQIKSQVATPVLTSQIKADIDQARDILAGLHGTLEVAGVPAIVDPKAQALLKEFTNPLMTVYFTVDSLGAEGKFKGMNASKASAESFPRGVAGLQTNVSAMQAWLLTERDNAVMMSNVGLLAGAMAGVLLILLGIISANESRKKANENRLQAELANKQNEDLQNSISNLIEEIVEISSGDLTSKATVTENDVTGVIADAFNSTTTQLRKVIQGIKDSAELVGGASLESIEASKQVEVVVNTQNTEVNSAAASVLKMVDSIKYVSSVSNSAASVAQNSITAAASGRVAVAEAIAAMEMIREQIQDTSKRLKRVGESSQEITEIAEVIADITERTGVLALNANVQAAAAGEAGRGFAAVAAEVQRLAVRSDSSLKKITTLVDTMQSDTREAISAMESTTQKVVGGANVATKAGDALVIIEMVAGELSELVAQVHAATETQNTDAGDIGDNMKRVLGLTEKTVSSIRSSITDIQKISGMAKALEESVAGFKV